MRQLLLAAALLVPAAAAAQDLVIGARTEPAVDPHFQWIATNTAYSRHVFSSLVEVGADGKEIPGLATSWRTIDDTTWEFALRPGVTFHDGRPFTAEDVVFTLNRVPNIPGNVSPYTTNIQSIVRTEVLNPHLVRFHTDRPNPMIPAQLPQVFIVSAEAARNATPADFRSGRAAIGTGPYRFGSFTPAGSYVLTRADTYWGEKPHWRNVTFRIIPSDTARAAALLAGDVQAIDFVAPSDVAGLRRNPEIAVVGGRSNRVLFLSPDTRPRISPLIADKQGRPIEPNPLRDLRVRRALSLAIDRQGLAQRFMDGFAEPASLMVPQGFLGFDDSVPVDPYDPARARALLAEAGFPDGFAITIHCTNNRYVNDARVCQAVGQMLARIGLAVQVQTVPANIFFSRNGAEGSEYSLSMVGWGTAAEASSGLVAWIHTFDRAGGFGFSNRGGYSDPALDRLIEQAIGIMDTTARDARLKEAMRITARDLPVIPLYNQYTITAVRKPLGYLPRVDEETSALSVTPGP
jgi:peptide/nickel transport system substrate-binding protein